MMKYLAFAVLLAACNSATGTIVDQPCAKDVCGCFPNICPEDGSCCEKDFVCSTVNGVKGCGYTGPDQPNSNGQFSHTGAKRQWHPRK